MVGRWRQMPAGVGSIPSCNNFFFSFVGLLFLSFTLVLSLVPVPFVTVSQNGKVQGLSSLEPISRNLGLNLTSLLWLGSSDDLYALLTEIAL